MKSISEELGTFQVALSQGLPAKVHPKIATDVFSSIKYLEDVTTVKLAQRMGITRQTATTYVKDLNTPNFNRFVHYMDRLGYQVILQKKTI